MKPALSFENITLNTCSFGKNATVPDLLGSINVQNRTKFTLDEDDEIFEAYGKLPNAYPYTQKAGYSRDVAQQSVRAAVLENDALKAVFLPDFGGRLWQLYDKKAGKDLLFTNDVLRPSNLAVRNAWFAGGVEWNISVIGHTPYTAEPLFVAKTSLDDGTPVLRMYEYERIRAVTYQMDFWLSENDTALNCRMRIENSSKNVVPMYWWSNIAMPEEKGMRIAVNAKSAYTGNETTVYKTSVPLKDGLDVTYPEKIPAQIDYFFNLEKHSQKYIAAIYKDGSAMLQSSTQRLQGRKLFSWGHTQASSTWQKFLNDSGRNYLEIQAGLGKTQYGCIPMPPHTAWEWLEQYQPYKFDSGLLSLPHDEFVSCVDDIVAPDIEEAKLESLLDATKNMAKSPAEKVSDGGKYGAFAAYCRNINGDVPLAPQLDFGKCDASFKPWKKLVTEHELPAEDTSVAPQHYFADDYIFDALKKAIKSPNAAWNTYYHLGLNYFVREDYERAEATLEKSLTIQETAWALHALAATQMKLNKNENAAQSILKGAALMQNDASYINDAMRILAALAQHDKAAKLYEALPATVKEDSRLKFDYITALAESGKEQTAFDMLCENGGFLPADIREGEDSTGNLYKKLHKALFGTDGTVPDKLNFKD